MRLTVPRHLPQKLHKNYLQKISLEVLCSFYLITAMSKPAHVDSKNSIKISNFKLFL